MNESDEGEEDGELTASSDSELFRWADEGDEDADDDEEDDVDRIDWLTTGAMFAFDD